MNSCLPMRLWLAAAGVVLGLPSGGAFADDIADKAAVCAACHGDNGVPTDSKFPIIWGQKAGYLYIELRDMQSGARKNEVMAPLIKDFSKDDVLALAQYFEAKPWPSTGYTASKEDTDKANPIEVAGQCTSCHQNGYLGGPNAPRLAGQNVQYLIKTTQDFKTRERANNPFMSDMLGSFKDEDIQVMSRFLAGQ